MNDYIAIMSKKDGGTRISFFASDISEARRTMAARYPGVVFEWIGPTPRLRDGKPVFNAQQCEGIESHLPTSENGPAIVHQPIPEAEHVIAAMPKRPDIRHGLGKAFYSPKEDYVGMPTKEAFTSTEGYFDTLFHELTHSTCCLCCTHSRAKMAM